MSFQVKDTTGLPQKSVTEDDTIKQYHSKVNIIDEETDKELAEWIKKKYDAYNVTWKDVKYQVWSANISHLFFIIEGILFAIVNQKRDSIHDDNDSSLVMIIGSILIGTLMSGPLMNLFGRKATNLFVAVPCSIAWFMIFFPLKNSVFFENTAKCLVGLAMGLETSSIVYVSEISHKKYRPFLLSLSTFNFAVGIHLMRILDSILPWPIILLLSAALLFSATILVAYFIPESPVWLTCYRTDLTEAKQSLKWLNPNPEVFDDELKELTRTVQHEKDTTKRYYNALFCPNVYKPLCILLVLLTLQQASCLHAFLTYSSEVASKISPLSVDSGSQISDFMGTCRLLVNVVGCSLYLKFGRRPAFMVSSIGMTVTSILLVILLQCDSLGSFGWNRIVLFFLFVMFGSIGVMTIPWSLTVELLPHRARSVGCAALMFYGNLLLFVFEANLPTVLYTVSATALFVSVAAASALMAVTFYFLVPETFGKSFGEIQLAFAK